MKTIICFFANKKPSGSLIMQIKNVLSFRYTVQSEEMTKGPDGTICCIYVSEYAEDKSLPWLCKQILYWKKRKFLKKYAIDSTTCQLKDSSSKPPLIYSVCIDEFLKQIKYEKNTVLGWVDGDLLDYKIWVRLIRRHLAQINCLMIVSNMPERFVELCHDAWEEQGLAITLTHNKKELCFCDYVIDCSGELFDERVVFRKPCRYLMLSEQRKKKKQLKLHNRDLQMIGCSHFLINLKK